MVSLSNKVYLWVLKMDRKATLYAEHYMLFFHTQFKAEPRGYIISYQL